MPYELSTPARTPLHGMGCLVCFRPMSVIASFLLATVQPCFLLATLSRAADDIPCRVERADGGLVSGRLVRIGAAGVVVEAAGSETVIPLDGVRTVESTAAQGVTEGIVRLSLVDGGWLEGSDLSWDGTAVSVTRPDGIVELPVERLRSVAWRSGKAAGAQPVPGAAWLGALPDSIESDLLIVGSDEAHEFVECAITSITAQTVSVVLDEETIPVKRSKIIGLHWLRTAPEVTRSGAVAVDLAGGSLRADVVEWSPQGMVLDGSVRLPADALRRIDWAAGRTVSLVSLATERLDVEPYFGALGRLPGLTAYFSPRGVGPGEGFAAPGLVVRPRTVAVWRLPPESRRLRTTVAPAAGSRASGGALLVIALDDRELFRRQIDARVCTPDFPEGVPLDLDVAGGRRLTISVDFSAADPGCPVRLTSPMIEQ